MRIHSCVLGLLLVLTGCDVSVSTGASDKLPPATPGTSAQQTEALQAAKSIVTAIDRGEFEQVWDRSDQLMRESTYKVVFVKTMAATRGNLGQPGSRGAPRVGFARKIDPNAPEGDYSVVEVDTDFSGRTITEKVILSRESGEWRLVGYFMQASGTLGG